LEALVFLINKALVAGLVIGSIYALGAIGVTLIFGILRFAHFAHGDLMTLGAFFTLALAGIGASLGIATPFPIALAALLPAMLLTAASAIAIDRTFYRPLRLAKVRPIIIVIASVGVTLMLQGAIRLVAGVGTRNMFFDQAKDIHRFTLPGARREIVMTEPQVVLVALTICAMVGLHWFLTRSRLGKAMRAVSDNPDLARITGIDTDRVVRATWVTAGALACAAGSLLSMDVFLKPDLAFNLLLPIFAAAIVGGIGQPFGAIAGGFLIGFSETLAIFDWGVLFRELNPLLPALLQLPTSFAFVPTEYKLMVPFVILIIVLVYRPTGVFRGKVF